MLMYKLAFCRRKYKKSCLVSAFFLLKQKDLNCHGCLGKNSLSVSKNFGKVTPFSASLILEVSAQVLPKVPTKCSFRNEMK